MKKCSFLLVAALLLLAACGTRNNPPETVAGNNEYAAEVAADGIQRMSDYHYSDTIRTGGNTYLYTIHRTCCDTLPVITDDDGNRYADNIYTLTIQSGDATVIRRHFTKMDFAAYLSGDFRQQGLLDGMMYDSGLPGLCFAVSVTLPQSDMVEPLIMRLSPAGSINIQRDDRGEAELDTAAAEDGV